VIFIAFRKHRHISGLGKKRAGRASEIKIPERVTSETHVITTITERVTDDIHVITTIINKALKELPTGKILFNPPEEMKVGDTELVEVRITHNITEDLTKGLEGRGKAKIKETEVSSYMKVRLTGNAFKIVPEISEPQIIESDKYTEWQFHVTPLKSGIQTLHLIYYVIISIAGYDDKQKAYKVGDWKVNVKVNPMYFLKCYWQFIVGTLIAIVTLIIAIIAIM
jgi:hypothetical protein